MQEMSKKKKGKRKPRYEKQGQSKIRSGSDPLGKVFSERTGAKLLYPKGMNKEKMQKWKEYWDYWDRWWGDMRKDMKLKRENV